MAVQKVSNSNNISNNSSNSNSKSNSNSNSNSNIAVWGVVRVYSLLLVAC